MFVSDLYIHPIKAMQGLRVNRATVTDGGLLGDRVFAVVLARNGVTLTARERPALMGIKPTFDDNGTLYLSYQGQTVQAVPSNTDLQSGYTVWGDAMTGMDMGDTVAEFLTAILGKPVRLIAVTQDSRRDGDLSIIPHSFVDLAPLLLTTEESLSALNEGLEKPVDQRNFRPNIVISGLDHAYNEDLWAELKIGEVQLEVTMGCARCSVPDVDPDTQAVDKSMPVNKRLRDTRQEADKQVYFGQNARILAVGTINIGDRVEIIKLRDRQRLSAEAKDIYSL